jgi:predicted dehydrogenase
MTTPLRIGVIGAGAIATLGHIPGFQRLPDVQVAAICDANVARAQNVAVQFGIPAVYEDYQSLLVEADLEAITVAVPNALHAAVTLAALEAGKHVLCEKPLATTVEDGQAMVVAAERAGKILAINMHNRLRPEMIVLRTAIVEQRLGAIAYTNARWLRRSGIPGFGSWFTRRELAGGGVLMDTGVHMLDLVLWLLGFPEVRGVRGATQSIHGSRGRGLGGWGVDHIAGGTFDVEDFAALHLRLASGGLITVEVSWAVYGPDEERVQLFGDEGGADVFVNLYGRETPLRMFREESGRPADIIPMLPRLPGSEWDRSMASFVAALRDGAAPVATGAEALQVLKLLDATYRSAAEGHEIAL